MTGANRLPLALAALLAWAGVSCRQMGPVPALVAPAPSLSADTPPAAPARLRPKAVPAAQAAAPRAQLPPAPAPSSPGSRVVWKEAPLLRAAPKGVGAFLAGVESRLPPEMGTHFRDKSHMTWCHETTHGVHAALRNKHRLPAFYPGKGEFALVEPPAVTLADVAAAVPRQLRGGRYQLYLVKQRRDWGREPLYVWDEWVAYDNGTTTGVEEGGRGEKGATDDAVACLEFSGYALAVAAAAREKGVPVTRQFREFLAWELRRSLGLYARAVAMPAFAWHDRGLERAWREGDPFVARELRALYGDGLTVRDLLP